MPPGAAGSGRPATPGEGSLPGDSTMPGTGAQGSASSAGTSSGAGTSGGTQSVASGNGDGGINASVNAGGVSVGTDGVSVGAGGVTVGSGGISVAGMPVGGVMPGTGSGSGTEPGTGTGAGGATGTGNAGMPGGLPAGRAGVPSGTAGGVMTTQDRVAVLDGALGRGYEDFDGLILAERSRAQRQSNEAGGDPAGLYSEQNTAGGAGGMPGVQMPGQGGQGAGMPGGVIASTSGQGPQSGGSGGSMGGRQGGPSAEAEGAYPVPEDIPGGDNDDVVARQIREAAMNEPDPELRERLWDEYRRYTGLLQ